MSPRIPLLIAAAAVVTLPFVPLPAEPGGAVGREQRMKEQALPQRKAGEVPLELKSAVALLGKTRGEMASALKKQQALNAGARNQVAAALKLAQEAGAANAQKVEAIRKALESAMKDLEAQDRLGNFEIQRLMSQYNQAETLASSVQKKLDDTAKGVAGKI
jgi:hypothetical protein